MKSILAPYANRNLLLLWTAFFISVLGSKLLIIALVARNYALRGSAAEASVLFALDWATSLVVGLWVAPYIDRMRAKPALAGFNVAAGMSTLLLLLTVERLPLAYSLPLLALRACLCHAAYTSRIKALFELFDVGERGRFTSLINSSQYIAVGLAGAVGVYLLTFISIRAVILFDAATFFAAAALLSGVRPIAAAPVADGPRAKASWRSDLRESLAALRASPDLRDAVFYMAVLSALFQGSSSIIAATVPQSWFKLGESGTALYFAVIAAAVTIAVAANQVVLHRRGASEGEAGHRPGWILAAAALYLGVGAFDRSLILNLSCLAGMMAFFELAWLHQLNRLVKSAPAELIARVSALEMCVTLSAMGLASLLMGMLVDAFGVQPAVHAMMALLALLVAAWEGARYRAGGTLPLTQSA